MTRNLNLEIIKNLKRQDLYRKEAIEIGGFESRDITIDYSKMGLKMKGLNQIAAFYNARLQGYAKIYDAFNTKHQQKKDIDYRFYIILPLYDVWQTKEINLSKTKVLLKNKFLGSSYWCAILEYLNGSIKCIW